MARALLSAAATLRSSSFLLFLLAAGCSSTVQGTGQRPQDHPSIETPPASASSLPGAGEPCACTSDGRSPPDVYCC